MPTAAHEADHGAPLPPLPLGEGRDEGAFLPFPSARGVGGEGAKDPVCGMTVNPERSQHQAQHGGRTFHFCGPRCREKFLADPDKYQGSDRAIQTSGHRAIPPAPPGEPPEATLYTCPMHPEVRQSGPGSCPICGMALEPMRASAEPRQNPELADMTRRFVIGLALAIPLVAIEMGNLLAYPASAVVQFALATPVVAWAGAPLFARGFRSFASRNLNMFSLITLGAGIAYLESLFATFLPEVFPNLDVPLYYEPAAVIVVLVLLGQVLEIRAREQTGQAIRALLDLAPKTARRIRGDGTDEDVALALVGVGDQLRVRPGEAVPVDGIVLEGTSHVTESMVSGEAMPVAKGPGEQLIGGTLNGSGPLVMQAEKVGADTMLARIVAMVSEAERSRAPAQRLADSVSRVFVPAVVAIAAAAFIAWFAAGAGFGFALLAAISVLIIACPCALGLATPVSIMVGVGNGARMGVLFRSAEALERLTKVNTLVLDKTGTLTEGKPRVTAIEPVPGLAEEELLRLAASLERASEHPIAGALIAAAQEKKLALALPTDVRTAAGKGITGRVDGRKLALGNARLMTELGIAVDHEATEPTSAGTTVLFAALDGRAAGLIGIADPIKPSARGAIAALRGDGMRIVMLSGDRRATAEAVGRELGIDEVIAEVLPADKRDTVRRLQAEGRVVAMAGDGVND
ncbi:MAG: heavy metal translocating P-type ATPase, partial [Acetobacteraceae bacterium]